MGTGVKVLAMNHTTAPPASYQLLAGEGYEVDTAPDPDTGLERLVSRNYDVIIIQESPQAESWRLCERIRRLSGMPLIVISQNASADACARAIEAGADYFLRKPFGPLEFLARVRCLLQRRVPNQPATVSP